MGMNMIEIELKYFVKCLILQVGLFETEIIDERNFSLDDEEGIMCFKQKYCGRKDCIFVKVNM